MTYVPPTTLTPKLFPSSSPPKTIFSQFSTQNYLLPVLHIKLSPHSSPSKTMSFQFPPKTISSQFSTQSYLLLVLHAKLSLPGSPHKASFNPASFVSILNICFQHHISLLKTDLKNLLHILNKELGVPHVYPYMAYD